MAATALELNTISKAMQTAKTLVEDLKGVIDEVDVLYNSAGGVGSTITQAKLDGVASYSGLTTQQLADGMFALTSTVKTALVNTYTALAEMAARV